MRTLFVTVLLALFFIPMVAWSAAQHSVSGTRSTKNSGHLIAPITVSGDSNTVVISAGGNASLQKLFEGLLLWNIRMTPGADDAAPESTVDVTVACDGWSLTWTGLSNTETSTKTIYEADSPPSAAPMVTGDVTVTVSDLGTGNTAVVDLIFW